MKLNTNIVLVGDPGPTQPYVIQLEPGNVAASFLYNKLSDSIPGDRGYILPADVSRNLINEGNEWSINDINGNSLTIPKSTARIYFPQYSADTFASGCTYILSFFTYIHAVKIQLGCFVFNRKNSYACPPTKFNGMEEYYEYMDFTIADPFSIHYSDDAISMRKYFGEPQNINDTGSILYISLHVVEESSNHYIMKDGWTGGQNSLLISDPEDLSLHIDYNVLNRCIDMKIRYNSTYVDGLREYLKETYNSGDCALIWEYVIMDKDNIYYKYNKVLEGYRSFDYGYDESFSIKFDSVIDNASLPISDGFDTEDAPFKTLYDWKEGLYIIGSVSFIDSSSTSQFDLDEYYPYMTIFSNKIFLNQKLFATMLSHGEIPSKINLDNLDMNNITLNTINKIVKTTKNITIEQGLSKSHIIQPVFYQTREIGNVVIHPAVTENIALNLESYKPQVKRFMIQIEGILFKEIGRTSKGIIFKVYGNMLPKNVNDGILYVLNQDGDLVTTGKFIYSY